LASKCWVATVFSANVVVVTVSLLRKVACSINTFSNGTQVVIFANNSSVNTFVAVRIASINSARISVVTSLRNSRNRSNLSGSTITLELVFAQASSSWDLETTLCHQSQAKSISVTSCRFNSTVFRNHLWNRLASFISIAIVDSAFVSIITVSWSVNDSFDCITSSNCACIWVSNLFRNKSASSCNITTVISTCVLVIAYNLFIYTFSSNTDVFGARIFVIAVLWFGLASFDWAAMSYEASIIIFASDWCVDTSNCRIAAINSASILIIAVSWCRFASLDCIARRNRAFICRFACIDEFAFSIYADIVGARVVIVTGNSGVGASLFNVTSIDCVRIIIVTQLIIWSMNTSTVIIASVNGTCNVIITVQWSQGASSFNIAFSNLANS
jgi:hypothetical protein